MKWVLILLLAVAAGFAGRYAGEALVGDHRTAVSAND